MLVKGGFHSGGPGYLISNAAFTPLCERLKNSVSFCQNSGIEDVDINSCLRELGVKMGNSLDEKGRLRFLAFSLKDTFYGELFKYFIQLKFIILN